MVYFCKGASLVTLVSGILLSVRKDQLNKACFVRCYKKWRKCQGIFSLSLKYKRLLYSTSKTSTCCKLTVNPQPSPPPPPSSFKVCQVTQMKFLKTYSCISKHISYTMEHLISDLAENPPPQWRQVSRLVRSLSDILAYRWNNLHPYVTCEGLGYIDLLTLPRQTLVRPAGYKRCDPCVEVYCWSYGNWWPLLARLSNLNDTKVI